MKRPTNNQIKTITMSYENLEAAISTFLYATKTVPQSWDITFLDLGLPVNENGLVEFDIEISKPISRQLKVVGKDFQETTQLDLQFETFEKIHVND